MNLKSLALAIVILLAGLSPATAIIGFCARMPCCGHQPAASLSLTTERADCCTTITCYESPSAKLATTVSAPHPHALPLVLLIVPALPAPVASTAPPPIDTSPPRAMRDRLAVLSILLI